MPSRKLMSKRTMSRKSTSGKKIGTSRPRVFRLTNGNPPEEAYQYTHGQERLHKIDYSKVGYVEVGRASLGAVQLDDGREVYPVDIDNEGRQYYHTVREAKLATEYHRKKAKKFF